MTLKERASNLNRLSLAQLPHPRERLERIKKKSILVAEHELNHALVSLHYKISPELVSVIPNGNSLGRNVFAGSIDREAFKIIAAAGAISTTRRAASGFSRDLSIVDTLSFSYGGGSRRSVLFEAETILLSYPPSVRRRAAEILAYLEEVPGSLITQIIKRAKEEIEFEEGITYQEVPKVLEWADKKDERPHGVEKTKTIIENLGKGLFEVVVVKGNTEEKYQYCSRCNEWGGHKIECPTNTSTNVEDRERGVLGTSGAMKLENTTLEKKWEG